MELTSEGVAQAVFDRMATKDCDETEAITWVYQTLLRSNGNLTALWREEGQRIVKQWSRDMLRGYNGTGPRPTMPLNYGRNRRRERARSIGPLNTLYRLPDGKLKPLGDMTGLDWDEAAEAHRNIADRNLYHVAEIKHLRTYITDKGSTAAAFKKMDEHAKAYLHKIARWPADEGDDEGVA